MEDLNNNKSISKSYQEVLGQFKKLKDEHNGKAQYENIENHDVKLFFHSTWMNNSGSFWAVIMYCIFKYLVNSNMYKY